MSEVRFELRHDRCCISELRRGEAKRVPRDLLREPLGFYIACPSCGRPQIVQCTRLDPECGQVFTEEPPEGWLTMAPGHTCDRCARRFEIQRGAFVIHAT